MAAHGPNALPPTTVLSTQEITQSAAHEFLAAYLNRATNDPSLQPNATVGENGPVSRTTAAAPNLTIHNLKRVQAGLAGEYLGRDLTVAKQNPGEDYLDVAAAPEGEADQENADDNDVDMNEAGFDAEAEAFEDQEGEQTTIDKEERKKKKKERRAAEKKAKAKKADDSE